MSKHDDDRQMMACIADRNVWPAGGFDSFRSSRHENGQAHGRPGTKRRQGLFVCSVSALALLLVTAPVWADGGAGGGAAFEPSTGGAGGTATQPNGSAGIGLSGGGGGGGGGVSSTNGHGGAGGAGGDHDGPGGSGGAGGAPALVTASDDANTSALTGVPGGRGANGSGAPSSGGGGGGGGGFGWVIRGTGNASNAGTITGGAGGTGGHDGGGGAAGGGGGGQGGGGVLLTGGGRLSLSAGRVVGGAGGAGGRSDLALSFAGTGGDGGHGVLLTAGGDVINAAGAAIAGGAGGSGGNTGDVVGGQGGNGGAGLAGTDFTLINSGQITGGTGGAGGSSSTAADGNAGDGGAGVSGSNLTITNSGSISGGMSGDGSTQADAIRFTGGVNRLELRAGSRIDGNVAAGGTTDTLTLGGAGDAIFHVGRVGSSARYQGFEFFEKTGTSTWTLTGTAAPPMPWTIEQGVLRAANAGALANGSAYTLNGGTLDLNDYALTMSALSGTGGQVTLGSADLTVDQSADTTYAGDISGAGGLAKQGTGTLTLTGTAETGLFDFAEGTVAVTDGGTLSQPDYISGGGNYVGRHSGDDASLVIANGGTVSVTNSVNVGRSAGSTGRVTVRGENSSLNTGIYVIGHDGNGAMTVDAAGQVTTISSIFVGGGDPGTTGTGTLTVTGDGSKVDAAEVQIANYGNGSTGTVTLGDGGTLASSSRVAMALNNSGGSAALNIGANSVDPGDAVAPGVLDTPALQFYEDSAHLNFNHTGTAYHFDAQLVSRNDGAGIVNHYAGTTILTGDSSAFSGDTVVHGGTLAVDGTLGNAASVTTVASGGTLGGSGSTGGAVTVADGGTLSGAAGQTLGMGSLALSGGSNVDVALGAPGDTALFDVNGDLTLDGSLNVSDAGGFGAGVYRIFDYGGDLTDNGLAIGTTPGGTSADNLRVQTATANQVNLVSTAGLALGFWDGGDMANRDNAAIDGGSGTWQVGDSHWTGMDGAINGPYQPNPTFAVFQGQSGTVTVDDGPGAIQVTGLQFASDGYQIEGDAIELTGDDAVIRVGDGTQAGANTTATIDSRLTGSGGLDKTDLGTLILTGNNTYTGGTTVTAGTLQGNSNSLQGDITDNAALIFDQSSAGTYADRIDGSGALTKTGAGALTLTATNTYTGGTVVDRGVLQAQSTGALGSGDATIENRAQLTFMGNDVGAGEHTIQVKDGGFLAFRDGATSDTAAIDIQDGATTQFNSTSTAGESVVMNAGVIGFGNESTASQATITNVGGGSVFGRQATAGQATILNTNNGGTTFGGHATAGRATITNDSSGFTDFIDQSSGDHATLINKTGGAVDVSAHSGSIGLGSLSGAGDVFLGDNVLTLGALGNDDTIDGVLQDGTRGGGGATGGALTKTGTGVLTLTATNTYTGGTTVAAGTLAVDGSIAGDTRVNRGATLGGSGMVAGAVSIANGGTLSGHAGQTLGMGSLALSSGSSVDVALASPDDTALFDVANDLTLDGTLNVSDAGGFGAGVYRLFDYGGTLTDHGLDIGASPAGVAAVNLAVQTATEHQVNLINTSDQTLNFWDGDNLANRNNNVIDGGDGIWQVGDRHWTSMDGSANGPFQPNPTMAVFEGNAGTVTVDDSNGAIQVTGIQFATDSYQVAGDAIELANADTAIRVGDGTQAGANMTATLASPLTGSGGLDKTDLGTLILTGANSYTGGTTLSAGTLSVSADANLGDAAGNIVFAGGQLASTQSFDSARAATLDADGRFDIAAGTTLGLSGNLTGTGNLVKTGDGVLSLTGSNAYGDTQVAAGRLEGDASSISGNIANAGTLVFNQADDATFDGDIAGLNASNGTLIKRGAGELTLAGTSVLDTTIDAGGLVSSTDRFGGDLDIASGAQMTFDQADIGAYAGTLTGAGDLLFTGGGGVALTGDSSGFAGTSTVTDSVLVVNQTLGGALDVGAGGRLQGNGTVGDTTIADDGTVAPGNSIGTLHVNGDITFAPGARYEVEVDPTGTDSDLIAATGTANIGGGAVAHIGANGHYDPTSTYTILTADNGVNGTFDSVASDFTFLDAILGYDANDVTLTLQRNDIAFVDSADTRNQRAAARGADSLTFGDPLYDRVVQLDDPSARRAFDLLSGEVHASTQTALIQDSRYLRQAMLQRLRSAPASGATASDADSAHWIRAIGAFGGSDSDGNAASLDRSTRGFLLGGDTQLADYWRVGATAGFTRTDVDVDARQSSGDSDNYHLGIYTGTQATPVRFTLGAGYSWHDIDTQRSVIFPGLSDRLQSAHHAATAQVFGELGYAIDFGTTEVEPFANAAYVNLDSDGFTEHGGAAALHVDGDNTNTTFSTLGLRLAHTLDLGSTTIALHTSAGWRHAYGDTTPTVTNAYAGSSNFTVAGVPIEDNSAVVDAGLSVGIADNTSLGVSYGGLFGSDVHDNSGKLDLTVRF